jgi:glycine cleavage system H protein
MAEFPENVKYAATHEWARLEDDGTVTIGISDHAQEALGDVVYVELPENDAVLVAGDEAGVVESVKAASDIYAPIAGTVVAINNELEDSPEAVNDSPYGEGWFYKLKPENSDQMSSLLSAGDYQKICEEEAH